MRKNETINRNKISVIIKTTVVIQGAISLKKLKERILISPNNKAAIPIDL